MTNIVEHDAHKAPSLPTYGYQIARAIGGNIMTSERAKFRPLEIRLLMSGPPVSSIFSIPLVTPACKRRIWVRMRPNSKVFTHRSWHKMQARMNVATLSSAAIMFRQFSLIRFTLGWNAENSDPVNP